MDDVTERKHAEEKIESLNAELAARAAELETANQELEAFNYTVAHDLRGPLNLINLFSQAVRDQCGGNLEPQCREYLAEMYNGTMRMNQLIDALLRFSSMSHAELDLQSVDLSVLAQEIAVELQLANPERRGDFRIADAIRVNGDPKLLRVVLTNLLGNAWKFTGGRDEAVIEFGQTEVDGRAVCFVRDNGAGFPREDADQLFIPFRRSHGAEQFKGFGVGLATVERIVRRHGGRIWAEGEPGRGASFYFSIP